MAEQPRKAVAEQLVRDKGISYGHHRPLQRTDGQWIIYDERLPLGRRTVGGATYPTFEAASGMAQSLSLGELGKPPA